MGNPESSEARLTKEQLAIALYGLFDRLWVKSEGLISKEESRALMEAAQFFQLEANVVAAAEPPTKPDEFVAWECAACKLTNRGERIKCVYCGADR